MVGRKASTGKKEAAAAEASVGVVVPPANERSGRRLPSPSVWTKDEEGRKAVGKKGMGQGRKKKKRRGSDEGWWDEGVGRKRMGWTSKVCGSHRRCWGIRLLPPDFRLRCLWSVAPVHFPGRAIQTVCVVAPVVVGVEPEAKSGVMPRGASVAPIPHDGTAGACAVVLGYSRKPAGSVAVG